MYQSLSSQILKFNLRPDLYAHASWLQDLNKARGKIRVDGNEDLVAAEYLLKRYGLYKNFCWYFNTSLEKLALHDVTLVNKYIISLIYCTQIRRTIAGEKYRAWLEMLTQPVMNFSLFRAPYLPNHRLSDMAISVDSASDQYLQIMETSMAVMKYLFYPVSYSIWMRVRMCFPRDLYLRERSLPNLGLTRFAQWFMKKIVTQELGYAIH